MCVAALARERGDHAEEQRRSAQSPEMGTGTAEDLGANPHFLGPPNNVCGST